MENQHRLIVGYRELTADEIADMNALKMLDAQIQQHVKRLREAQYTEVIDNGGKGIEASQASLFLEQGSINVQTGIMQIIRAIARPTHVIKE
jgi:hypothetical protein